MTCGACGHENAPEATFCGRCGRELTALDLPRSRRRGVPIGTTAATRTEAGSPGTTATFDSTRYLCAGVQLDSGFAERVLDEVVAEEFRASPASHGVDLIPVLRHAIAARRRQAVRDVALSILLLLIVYNVLSTNVLMLLLWLLVSWAVISVENYVALYGVGAGMLSPSTFDPDKAPQPSARQLQQRIAELGERSQGNVTVYSGYDAFAGFGGRESAWSFVLDVRKPREGSTVRAITAVDLHNELEREVRSLDLGRVVVEQRVFVDGRDLRGDRRFLPSDDAPPVSSVDMGVIRALLLTPEDRVRPYACFHVLGWKGQLVLSTFLRCVVTKQHLFVEVTHTVLPPVKEEFQEVDHLLAQPTLSQLTSLLTRNLRRTPRRLVSAPGSLGRIAGEPWQRSRRRARQRREIEAQLRFDYGTRLEPRTIATDGKYQRYFQQLDREHYSGVVNKAILQSLVEILGARGIDTAELEQRQTTILNSGVYITGGASVTADNIAAGFGAQARSGLSNAAAGAAARMAPSSTSRSGTE